MKLPRLLILALAATTLLTTGLFAAGPIKLLNVSYDPTRELYQNFNAAFAKYWKAKTGVDVQISQSHGGSGAQARSVIDGLQADVVTLALAYDIDVISDKAGLIPKNWQTRLPNSSTPYTSTIVFLVRKGNPKKIKDWEDLVKPGVGIIVANPKTSGGARWAYLAAWGAALKKNKNDDAKAQDFVTRLYKNVPVLDSGARGATTTFVQRGIGDVLLSWENEAYLALNELGKDKFEVVTPPISILAEPPVSIVDKVAAKHGTTEVAKAYLEYLYTEEGQEIAAKNYYRPRNEKIAAKYASQYPKISLFTIDDTFGGWTKTQKRHFDDGGVFDKIYTPGR
jgi:sulfate/thiosulfate transport system substrate-binding protein